jgi:hypothetical protein
MTTLTLTDLLSGKIGDLVTFTPLNLEAGTMSFQPFLTGASDLIGMITKVPVDVIGKIVETLFGVGLSDLQKNVIGWLLVILVIIFVIGIIFFVAVR